MKMLTFRLEKCSVNVCERDDLKSKYLQFYYRGSGTKISHSQLSRVRVEMLHLYFFCVCVFCTAVRLS